MKFKAICVKKQNIEHRKRDRERFVYLPFSKCCRLDMGKKSL